jgi:protein-disulfide isomerase
MNKTLVAPVLTSLVVLLAACGRGTDGGGGGDSPRAEVQARPSPPAQIAPAPKPAAAAAADAEPCDCKHGACDVDADADDGQVHDVRIGSSPVRGSARAPVTVVVFTDFQCPFCAKSEVTMRELAAEYGDQVRIVFKNNPLPFHDQARLVARAALAAGEQGKFWEYHDLVFAHQDALGGDALLGYATELGLDLVKFRAALDADRTGAAVDADVAEAKRLAVMGTPAFFVNGRRIVGAQPLAKFEALVDEALAGGR